MVPDLLNLSLVYLIYLARVRSSLLCIFRICVAAGPLPTSYRALSILVRYAFLSAAFISWVISLSNLSKSHARCVRSA